MALNHWTRAIIVAGLIAGFSAPSRATDVWTAPNPGLKHLHRTTVAPENFHALVVDLRQKGVRIRVTPKAERWKTTSRYARDARLAAAVNGGLWSLFAQKALGLVMSDGKRWSKDAAGHGVFFIDSAGLAGISAPGEPRPASGTIVQGLSGYPFLVDGGKLTPKVVKRHSGRDARTAVGVSKDGKTVFLVTADGRQADSVGASLDEVGDFLIELGAERAINMDGGNSTTIFIAAEGGVVNHPSRGWEREMVTHIGVAAPAPGAPPIPPEILATPQAVQALAASAIPQAYRGTRGRLSSIWLLDRIFLGPAREIVIPGFVGIAPWAFLAMLWIGLRRIVTKHRKQERS